MTHIRSGRSAVVRYRRASVGRPPTWRNLFRIETFGCNTMSSRLNQTTNLPLNIYRMTQIGIGSGRQAETLTALVLTAWRMGLWFAKAIVEQHRPCSSANEWNCSVWYATGQQGVCETTNVYANRCEWKRRIGRCPRRCPGSQQVPFDVVLNMLINKPQPRLGA